MFFVPFGYFAFRPAKSRLKGGLWLSAAVKSLYILSRRTGFVKKNFYEKVSFTAADALDTVRKYSVFI